MSLANSKPVEASLVVPCYNEQECLPKTAGELLAAFANHGIPCQLVLVDNGSRDRTAAIIDELIAQGQPVTKVTVAVNCGYGNGVLQGLKVCAAPWVGITCADGQVTAEDTVQLFEAVLATGIPTLAKVRRRYRKDSWRRKLISVLYNFGMQGVFGWLGSIDLNGSPKVMPRKLIEAMQLTSRDWFLDPEIMVKTKYLGVRVVERNVEGQFRQGGRSNVRYITCWEFAKNILAYRFGALREWKASIRKSGAREKLKQPITENARP